MKKRVLFLIVCLAVSFTASADNNRVFSLIKNAGDASKYRGSDIVTLVDSTGVNVQETGLSHFRTYTLVKILTTRGALNQRVVKYDYDPLSAYTEVISAKIYRADGTVETIDLKTVQDYPAPARAIYWGARQKMIEFGALQPGDAVEVEMFKKGYTYALLAQQEADEESYIPPMRGHYYDIVPFWSSTPVLRKVYRVAIPNTKEMQYQFYNGECSASFRFEKDKKVYEFAKTDIMPLRAEPNQVDNFDVAPKLIMTTSPDWEAKSLWFYNVNEDYGSFDNYEPMNKMVKELIKNAKNDREKVSILTHWVADNMRYSGIPMGKGEGYTLHNAEMNFTDRCGVCKDKASLLIAMLRAAGFESYPAMTMAGSRIENIPADHFNHSVAVVKLDGKYELLDPTWVPFLRELWSSAEQQQNYLMGVPGGATLMETPISAPENHYVKVTAKSNIDAAGKLTGEFTITAEGQSDGAVRRPFTRGFISEWRTAMERELLAVSPNARLISVDYGKNPADYMAGPVVIKMKYEIPDYAFVGKNEMIFKPFVVNNLYNQVKSYLRINTSLKERKYGFKDACSRLVELNETITVPSGYKVSQNNLNVSKTSSAADFEGTLQQTGNTINYYSKMVMKKRVYEASDWVPVKEALDANANFSDNLFVVK